jgi:cysteine desulfurase family protein
MIYLDNAATSWPKPDCVYDAVVNCMKKYSANPGRSGHSMSLQAERIILYAREMLCRLFNVKDPFRMIFTANATESLNLGIKGILKPGDHVITTYMEHNSVIRPIIELNKQAVTSTFVKADSRGGIDPYDIKKAITSRTKLIVTTHASNVTGTILPIQSINKIARDYGIPYLLDAAQTAGSTPMDLSALAIDLVAFPGHKSLLGPQGTGVLYISPDVSLRQLKEGGTGSNSESLTQPEFCPDKFESGTLNTPGIAGLATAIKYILDETQSKLSAHIKKLEKHFLNEISNLRKITVYGPAEQILRTGVISINIKNRDSSEIAEILDKEHKIAVRGGLHCAPLAHQSIGTQKQGTVRFSFGIFNTLDEINICIEALKKIMRD